MSYQVHGTWFVVGDRLSWRIETGKKTKKNKGKRKGEKKREWAEKERDLARGTKRTKRQRGGVMNGEMVVRPF